MAMQPPVKTSSAHRSTLLRGTHRFDIIGYSRLKALGVRNTVRSGDFEAGGCTWALVCCFDVVLPGDSVPRQCQLASISLTLVSSNNNKDVIAKASLRIDDPTPPSPSPSGEKGRHRRWPAAVWRSAEAHIFPANTAAGSDSDDARSWKLSVPDAFRESLYVKDDRLAIHCTVEVLLQEKVGTSAATRSCSASVVPPPTVSRDLRNLLYPDKPKTKRTRFMTDVTFVVEQTEIHAHRLVLAMRSQVFAAELLGGMKESAACARVTIDDMSASTFKAMLFFIYTDELPSSHGPKHNNVGDLLVAADRYDLERLRLMCEKILAENMDAASAMTTLMLVHGRDRCKRLEASCIEYMASDPDVHAAVVATKEYKELKEKCGPFMTDVLERVWMRALATRTPASPSSTSSSSPSFSSSSFSSSKTSPQKSASMFNSSEVFTGSHEFRIPNFSAVLKMFVVGEYIESGAFPIGGCDWTVRVYPSGFDGEGWIGMCLQKMLTDPGTTSNIAWLTATFKIEDPSGLTPPNLRWAENFFGSGGMCLGVKKFMDLKTTQAYYVKSDGSLTIHCDVKVSQEYSYDTSTTAVGDTPAAIVPPASNIACHLERLLAVGQCFDVKFQVQDSEIQAHELVIAVRSPILHDVISSAPDKDHVRIDDMDVPVFMAVLHFIYADELELPLTMDAAATVTVTKDLLVAADRFGLDRMKAMCENMLCEQVTAENVVGTLELADRCRCEGLKEFCLEHISQPHVLKEVVETQSFKDLKVTSPRILEEIILKISKLSSMDCS